MTKRMILFFLILLNLATIFYFSHQTSKISGKLSSDITRKIEVYTPHYAEKNEAQQKVVHTQTQYFIRGMAHGALFFSLGILTLLFVKTFSTNWLWLLGNFVFGFFIALGDEIHQIFVPGRMFGWDDISYDMLGFTIGMLCVFLLEFTTKHQKRKTK